MLLLLLSIEQVISLRAAISERATGGAVQRRQQQQQWQQVHSLFGEELQRAVGGGDLTHGVAAALGEGRRRRLVVDVDAAVRPLDRRGAGRRAEEAGEAGAERRCSD